MCWTNAPRPSGITKCDGNKLCLVAPKYGSSVIPKTVTVSLFSSIESSKTCKVNTPFLQTLKH